MHHQITKISPSKVSHYKPAIILYNIPSYNNWLPCFQIEISGRCDFDNEFINIDTMLLDANDGIVLSRQGPCLSLYGSGSLETYREILLSARWEYSASQSIFYNRMRSFLCPTDI